MVFNTTCEELDAQIESRSSGLLGQARLMANHNLAKDTSFDCEASDILLSAKVAKVQGVRLQSQDEA